MIANLYSWVYRSGRMSLNEPRSDLERLFSFLGIAERLKSTLRYNSMRSGRRESSAEHSWRLVLMTVLFAQKYAPNLSEERLMKIALVHDLAEALAGDVDAVLIAEGKVTKEEKLRREEEAWNTMMDELPPDQGHQLSAWRSEYEVGATAEAMFVKAMDKLETLLQLVETGYAIYDKPDFIPMYADKAVAKVPELHGVLGEIKKRLKIEFNKGGIKWRGEYDAFLE